MMHTTLGTAHLNDLLKRLTAANETFTQLYPGLGGRRQPIHTVYGGAHLFKPGSTRKITNLAQRHFYDCFPDSKTLARIADIDDKLSVTLYNRIRQKLEMTQAIEDHRVDFEDGYGIRSDEEEDLHAVATARAMKVALTDETLPACGGIRIKALTEEAKTRSLRTLDLFISTLAPDLPEELLVTLPKVTHRTQVEVLTEVLGGLETALGIQPGTIKIELMLENVQSLFDEKGHLAIKDLANAGNGRVVTFVLGTFDYTATCNVTSHFQSHTHSSADFARQLMLADLQGTEISICDGITNIMPLPINRSAILTTMQQAENQHAIESAWKLHFDNVLHSMKTGIYQGWDLHPAQIPARIAAVYYFYLLGLQEAQARLGTFIAQATKASMVGNTFDDAATGQGLINFFLNGLACGALEESEAMVTGLTLDELSERSFSRIIQNRVGQQSLKS